MNKATSASAKVASDIAASAPSATKQVEAGSLRRRLPAILLDSWELRKFVPEGSVLPNALISWDVDGDGIEEVVVGTTEGHLLVLKPECRAPIFTYLIGATISIVLYSERQQRLVLCTMEGHCEVFEPFLSRPQQPSQPQQEAKRSVPSSPSTPMSAALAEEAVCAKAMPRNSSASHFTSAAVSQWRCMYSKGSDSNNNNNKMMKMGIPSASSHASLHDGVSAHDTELPASFVATAADHVFHIASNCLCGALGSDYSNNHNLLFLGSYDRRMYVYHVHSGSCLLSLFCHHPIMAVRSFSVPVPKHNRKNRHPTPTTTTAAAAAAAAGREGGGGSSDRRKREDEDDGGTDESPLSESIPLVAIATSHTLALLPAALTSIQSWDLQEKQTQRPLTLADPIALGGYDAFSEYTAATTKIFASCDDTERQAPYGVGNSADGASGAMSRITSNGNNNNNNNCSNNANNSLLTNHMSMTSLPPPTLVHPLWFLEIGLESIRVLPTRRSQEETENTIAPSPRHGNDERESEPELPGSLPKSSHVVPLLSVGRSVSPSAPTGGSAGEECGDHDCSALVSKEVVHLAIDIDVSVSATRAVLVAACEDGRAFVLNLSVDEAPLSTTDGASEHRSSSAGDTRAVEVVHGRTPSIPSMAHADPHRERSPDDDNNNTTAAAAENSGNGSFSRGRKPPRTFVLHDFTKHQAHVSQRQRRRRDKALIPPAPSTANNNKGFSVRHTTTNTKQGVPDYGERPSEDPLLTVEVPYPPSAKALRAQLLDVQPPPPRTAPPVSRRRQGSPSPMSRRGTEFALSAPREPLALLLRAECTWASGLDRNPLVQRARVFRVRADEFCAVFVSVNGDCYAVDPDQRTVVKSSIKADCTSFTIIAGGSSIMSGWRREPLKDEVPDGKPPTATAEDGGKGSGNRNLLSGAVGSTVSCVCIGVDELCIYSVGEAYLTITHKQFTDAQQGSRTGTTPGGSFHCQPPQSRSLAEGSSVPMSVSSAVLGSTGNNSFADLTYSLCCTPNQLTGAPGLDRLLAPFAYTPLRDAEQKEEEELLLELGQRLVDLEREAGDGGSGGGGGGGGRRAQWDPEQYVSYARQVLTKGFTEEEWRTLRDLDVCET